MNVNIHTNNKALGASVHDQKNKIKFSLNNPRNKKLFKVDSVIQKSIDDVDKIKNDNLVLEKELNKAIEVNNIDKEIDSINKLKNLLTVAWNIVEGLDEEKIFKVSFFHKNYI
jgi:predicted HTH domain antitoxin